MPLPRLARGVCHVCLSWVVRDVCKKLVVILSGGACPSVQPRGGILVSSFLANGGSTTHARRASLLMALNSSCHHVRVSHLLASTEVPSGDTSLG